MEPVATPTQTLEHGICGIVVNRGLIRDDDAAELLTRVRHRGPDETSSHAIGGTWLGHTRLSIVDVAGGTQPIASTDGTAWIACNGEIYNHEALREELGRERFRTASDSESALQAVLHWGPQGIGRLNGMFALCVAYEDGRLLAARDPLGIKPLYWIREGEHVLLASELRAFPKSRRHQVEPFPPGHVWTSDGGLRRLWTFTDEKPLFTDRARARDAVRDVLGLAVRRRLMADVGVGVFLSGGLDSSIVAALAARAVHAQGHQLKSFAVGTEGSPDLKAARLVAEHLDLDHAERVYDADEAERELEEVVAAIESFEPSLVRSAVPNYFLAERAAQDVKVVLTGEGADELFAGYDYLRGVTDPEELQRELLRSVLGLHNLNLQRCDRVTMAHGLEARVPFLDLDVIDVAQRIPVAWKLPGELGQEKRLLREAFDGWLPDEILWRRKQQFGDGSGAAEIFQRAAEVGAAHAGAATGDAGSPAPLVDESLPMPRTAEERRYQELFARHLAGIDVDQVLGRFATP